ncbi:MAG: stage IV sporulation protein A [Thermaerobacter sp.]|nr:stage IV sporulation protein A [Bacillota bacterium]REJ33824.1 MAG: stage IV sporulation protein A [Bacillota bacterium]
MEKLDVIQDIAVRTSGDVFIGVVGPVRSGKSTFIKRFMDVLVIPRIADPQVRARTIDELPQSGAGRTVMTTEPKFVPDEAVAIEVKEGLTIRVRLADSVGFPVAGALGYTEDDGPRMVHTPWFEDPIPFEEAAEVGTRKIIADHSTMGIIVTSDGTVTDLPREAYEEAEARTVQEVRAVEKPFVILLNTRRLGDPDVEALAEQLADRYGAPVLPVDVTRLEEDDLLVILEELLYEFPVTELNVRLPRWVEELDPDHWLRRHYEEAVEEAVQDVRKLRDVDGAVDRLAGFEHVASARVAELDLGSGAVSIDVHASDDLFWRVTEEVSGFRIDGRDGLLRLLRDLAHAKRAYDRLGSALRQVEERGYAMVMPTLDDMVFEEPEMIRKGNQFGVRLRASAPTLHLLRAQVSTEVTPLIGTEKQSEQLVNYLMEKFEDDPRKIWESDIFGQPLSDLLREGIHDKLNSLPDNARVKLRETLERIINEGSGGLICIIL